MIDLAPSSTSSETELSHHLLESMVRIRMIEEAIAERYSAQQMRCPVHLSIGQEAASAAQTPARP